MICHKTQTTNRPTLKQKLTHGTRRGLNVDDEKNSETVIHRFSSEWGQNQTVVRVACGRWRLVGTEERLNDDIFETHGK